MRIILAALTTALLFTACGDKEEPVTDTAVDLDGDGFDNFDDCDDDNADVYPGAQEICDGIDNDCDRRIDAVDPSVELGVGQANPAYVDLDGDGFGDPDSYQLFCTRPDDRIEDGSDCDDSEATTHPDSVEVCDDVDNDCNGEVDDNATDGTIWLADADGDLYGDPANSLLSCDQPRGYVFAESEEEYDCDDNDPARQPGAVWYGDADGDGFGDSTAAYVECEPPSGAVSNDQDCNDGDPELTPFTMWYRDLDGDGYGDDTIARQQCEQPAADWTRDGADCNPAEPDTYPGATDVCFDNIDNDCDGTADVGCGVEHCGIITAAETWDSSTMHTVTCLVQVYGSSAAVLTITEGAVVQFQPGTGIEVGNAAAGQLIVQGGSAGVTFTSDRAVPAPGDWDGIEFGPNDLGSSIDNLTLEYGGSGGFGAVHIVGGEFTMTNSTVSNSSGHGVYGDGGGVSLLQNNSFINNLGDGLRLGSNSNLNTTGGPTFTGNTLTGNGGYPLVIGANSLDQVDGSSNTFSPNTLEFIYIRPDIVNHDSTWADLTVPYVMGGSVYVQGSGVPHLIIEDGATFHMLGATTELFVGHSSPGSIFIDGHTQGVTFTSAQPTPAPGDWGGITLSSNSTGAVIDGLTVEYGGNNSYGNVRVLSSEAEISDSTIRFSHNDGVYVDISGNLLLTGTTVSDNTDYGVYMHPSGRLNTSGTSPGFINNTLTANGGPPILLAAQYLGELDTSSTFSGNTEDLVIVAADTVTESASWRNLGVPYEFRGDVFINGGTSPIVTIDPGTTLQFGAAADLKVGHSSFGSLAAVGTSALPIVFTSAQTTPAQGDWGGITLGPSCESSTDFRWVEVGYGGSNGFGNVYYDQCDYGSFQNASVHDSSSHGIYAYFTDAVFNSVTYSNNGTVNVHDNFYRVQ